MILGIAGSRTVRGSAAVERALLHLVGEGLEPKRLLCGVCGAVDYAVEAVAREYGLPLGRVESADRHEHAPQMGRLIALAERAHCLLILWDGRSEGTRMLIEHAARLGTPVALFTADGLPWPDEAAATHPLTAAP